MSFVKADRNQTNVPADVLVKRDAGITGLTVVLRILNGDDLDESVDFNDGVFKTAGHTTPTTACPAIDATNDPGLYGLSGGFDLTGITIPAGVNTLRFHYTVTAGGEVGDSYDVIELDDRLVDLVWDELNRGADHNIKDSTGKQQRQASGGVDTEDVVSAGASTLELAATESAINDFYAHRHIAIVGGLGIGQVRVIDSYVGATKVATVSRAWDTVPNATSEYLLLISSESTLTPLERTVLRDFFDATHGAGSWLTATPQQIRDAMKLAPTVGAPAVDSVDEHLDEILIDTAAIEPLVTTNLDATVSSRSDFDETADPVELLDAGGAAGTSAAELVVDVDVALSAAHGGGSWVGTSAQDWSAGERDQIRFRLAMDGSQTDPTTGVGTIEAILADTDSLDTVKLTAGRALNLDEITAARLAELDPANLPADVDTLLSRLSAARAGNLDEITAVRLAELDAANLPADVDTLLAGVALTPAAVADVWAYDLDANFAEGGDLEQAGGVVHFLRQLATNIGAEVAGNPGSYTIRNDADSGDIGSFTLLDATGGATVDVAGSPAQRGAFTP